MQTSVHFMQKRVLSWLFIVLFTMTLLAGCQQKSPVPMPEQAPCQTAYTYAPGNYIIDIASGSEVILDPLAHDFPLFCSPEEARIAIHNAIAQGGLPEGDWRVYSLDGEFSDLAVASSRGYMLRRMAALEDWVDEPKE